MQTTSRTIKTLALSAGKAIASVAALASSMVLVRIFSKEDFGTIRQALVIFAMASPFITLGLSQSVLYFIPTADKKRHGAIIAEAVIPMVLSGLIFYLFMVLGGNRIAASLWNNPKLENALLIFAPFAFISLARSPLSPSLIATNRVFLASCFGVFSGISVALVSTMFTLLYPALEITLSSQVLTHSVLLLVALVIFLKNFSLGIPSLQGMRQQLAFGIPLCLSSIVLVLSRNMDRVMVSSLCGLKEFAIFDRGAVELPLIGIITGSMTTVLFVDYRTLIEEARYDQILRLLHRSVEKSALFLMPAMCFLFVLAPEFIICLFGKQYESSATVFRIYLLLLPNRTIVFGSVAMAAGKTKELAIASIYTLSANLILSYVAISVLGYVGGAVSTVLVIYCVNGPLRATIAKNALRVSMSEFIPTKTLLRVFGLSLIPLVPVYVMIVTVPDSDPFSKLFFGAAIYLATILLVYWKAGYVTPNNVLKYLPFSKRST